MNSPFHPGEQAIQARLGIQSQMDQQGRRVIRDYLRSCTILNRGYLASV